MVAQMAPKSTRALKRPACGTRFELRTTAHGRKKVRVATLETVEKAPQSPVVADEYEAACGSLGAESPVVVNEYEATCGSLGAETPQPAPLSPAETLCMPSPSSHPEAPQTSPQLGTPPSSPLRPLE